MSVSFDTNILVYAYDGSNPGKQQAAERLRDRLMLCGALMAGQVCSEFLNAARKKRRIPMEVAQGTIKILANTLSLIEQQNEDRIAAAILAVARNLQFYDALLCTTLKRAGVTTLLSEDMSDGDSYGDVMVLNPFKRENAEAIELAFVAMGA